MHIQVHSDLQPALEIKSFLAMLPEVHPRPLSKSSCLYGPWGRSGESWEPQGWWQENKQSPQGTTELGEQREGARDTGLDPREAAAGNRKSQPLAQGLPSSSSSVTNQGRPTGDDKATQTSAPLWHWCPGMETEEAWRKWGAQGRIVGFTSCS